MSKDQKRKPSFRWFATSAAMVLILFVVNTGCQKESMTTEVSSDQYFPDLKQSNINDFDVVNLVSDVEEYDPLFIDKNLVNAWGIAFSDEGEIWVSSAEKGVSTIYNADGETEFPPVNIPFGNDVNGGNPTGQVYNNTPGFIIPSSNEKSEFIFATENGTIAAWASGATAITVADRSSEDAVYKGICIAKKNGQNFLYATDFHNGRIDVYDNAFNWVADNGFQDPNLPDSYAPFNIAEIQGQLYVTYAKQLAPDNEDDEAGPGNGLIDVFNTDGSFVKRFTSQGTLNSPWGIAAVPGQEAILIGNFGDGKINVFDLNGNFLKHLKSGDDAVEVEGLWALAFPHRNLEPSDRNRLYFTAGPDEEEHGVFGYIKPASE